MASSIEGQGSDVPEILIGKRKNNFFVYDSNHKLVFEAYTDDPIIETSRSDREIRTGKNNQVILERFMESHNFEITL